MGPFCSPCFFVVISIVSCNICRLLTYAHIMYLDRFSFSVKLDFSFTVVFVSFASRL